MKTRAGCGQPPVKDQYFGDVNDYRKYGLLRALIGGSQLSLGICWLRTVDDGGRDGESRRYLQHPERWRGYDADLYDALLRLLDPHVDRTVLHAESWTLLPGARYHHRRLGDDASGRRSYFAEAWPALRDADVLFLDPDNGIEVRSVPYGTGGRRSISTGARSTKPMGAATRSSSTSTSLARSGMHSSRTWPTGSGSVSPALASSPGGRRMRCISSPPVRSMGRRCRRAAIWCAIDGTVSFVSVRLRKWHRSARRWRHWHASDELEYDTRRSARLEQRAGETPIHAWRST